MSILVCGGAGYIGSHTCVELLAAGYDIVVADNYYNSCPEAIRRVKEISGKDFRFVEIDLTDAEKVEDTCPGNNILTQYNCTRKQENGYTCFDVYMAQGRPLNTQEYTLLQERVEKQAVTPQPQCPTMEPTCDAFLKALNYNLEFSWYLVNFPTSSFPQCRETYDCKRIDCYLPPQPQNGINDSTLVSCVYKRNQLFFVGSEITCRQVQR